MTPEVLKEMLADPDIQIRERDKYLWLYNTKTGEWTRWGPK